MELGKLKVIKSEDYSTAKLLKFLREVEGFRPVLNGEALGGQQYTLFTIYFYPLSSILFTLFVIAPVFLLCPFINLTDNIKFFLNSHSEEHLQLPFHPSPPFMEAACRQGKKKVCEKSRSQRETVIKRRRETIDALTERIDLSSPVSLLTPLSVRQCILLSRTFITVNF